MDDETPEELESLQDLRDAEDAADDALYEREACGESWRDLIALRAIREG